MPGGAFFMGGPDASLRIGVQSGWHRLVVLSPFFIDLREVTAAEFRSGKGTGTNWTGAVDGNDERDWCTLSPQPTARDPLPANCMKQSEAEAYCKRMGKTLPTEAQLEYVQGGLRMQPYVWGADIAELAPPAEACTWLVWGRGGFGVLSTDGFSKCLSSSQALPKMGGPEKAGWGSRDHLRVGEADILDLAGNLSEWAADAYETTDGPCWSDSILVDPRCTDNTGVTVFRGSSWEEDPSQLVAGVRVPVTSLGGTINVGFRCTRSAN